MPSSSPKCKSLRRHARVTAGVVRCRRRPRSGERGRGGAHCPGEGSESMPIFAVERTRTKVSRERRGGESAPDAGPRGRRLRRGRRAQPCAVLLRVRRAPGAGRRLRGQGRGGGSVARRLAAGGSLRESFREAIADGGALEVHYETRDHAQGGYLRPAGARPAQRVGAGGSGTASGALGRGAAVLRLRNAALTPVQLPGSTAPRLASQRATSQQASAQAAPAAQPASTSVGQWTPR